MVESQEHGLHHVAHIDERDVLPTESHGEVGVCLDALGHQEIVFFARTIDARRPEHDVGEIVANRVEILLGLQLAFSVGGVGLRNVGLANFLIRLLLADRAEDAERTEIDKALQWHLQLQQRVDKVTRAVGVHTEEIFLVQAFRHASSMHHIVELLPLHLLHELLFRREVEFDEVDALVFQKLARTGLANRSPHFHSTLQSFFDDKAANKSTGACH